MIKVYASAQESALEGAVKAFEVLESRNGRGNDFLGWMDLPEHTPESVIAGCEEVVREWKEKGVEVVVVIGIGGSYLGAKCAIEALSHTFSADVEPHKMRVVFAGHNLSQEYHSELLDFISDKSIACVVISKSGTTTEPAVAFRIIKEHIENRYGKDEASERIVAVTDKARGALKTLSDGEGYKTFVIPDNVGGRFSVLTPVGLLPIALAGFDIRKMLKGAADMARQ